MLKFLFKSPKYPTATYNFKSEYTFNNRMIISKELLNKEPDKIPVIIEKDYSLTSNLTKHKFLVPKSTTVLEFLISLRKNLLKIDSRESIFLFVDSRKIPNNNETFEKLYEQYRDRDGFLYCKINAMESYG